MSKKFIKNKNAFADKNCPANASEQITGIEQNYKTAINPVKSILKNFRDKICDKILNDKVFNIIGADFLHVCCFISQGVTIYTFKHVICFPTAGSHDIAVRYAKGM